MVRGSIQQREHCSMQGAARVEEGGLRDMIQIKQQQRTSEPLQGPWLPFLMPFAPGFRKHSN